jgi:hypothetical protein
MAYADAVRQCACMMNCGGPCSKHEQCGGPAPTVSMCSSCVSFQCTQAMQACAEH